jgi:hypothetical protein
MAYRQIPVLVSSEEETLMTRHRSLTILVSVALGVAAWSATPANTSAAVILTSNTSARYGSGNVTKASDGSNGVPLPHDGSNGAQVQNPHLLAAATGSSNLSNNAIGSASAWLGASVIDVPNGGTIWWIGGGGGAMFRDMLTVESATLPAGSDVQVQFSIHVTSSLLVTHTITPGGKSFAMGWVDMGIGITNRGAASFALDADQNKAVRDNSGNSPNLDLGLMNPNTPHLDVVFDAQVGDVIAFTVETDTDVTGGLSPVTVSTNPLVLDNAVGSAVSSVGLAFGATPLTADVTLSSEQYAGTFPPSAFANAAAAAAGLPPNPVPEPTTLTLLLAASLLSGRLRRSRSRRATCRAS